MFSLPEKLNLDGGERRVFLILDLGVNPDPPLFLLAFIDDSPPGDALNLNNEILESCL